MASQFPGRQKDLIAALQDFIQNIDNFDAHQVTKALKDFSTELAQLTNANSAPQTNFKKLAPVHEFDAEPILQATIHYPGHEALARELPAILTLRGISLNTDERPPLMDWLSLKVTCADKKESVDLLARVVQHTQNGIALEIEPVSQITRSQLLALAHAQTSQESTVYNSPDSNPPPKVCNKFIESEGEPLNRYNLEQTDLETILLEIAHRRGFGLLQIQHAAHTWQILYLHHQIVDIQHFPLRESESLNGLLLQSKNLSQEQFNQAQAYAKEHDIEPENALAELGILSETQIAQAHKARTMLLLQRLFERTVGHAAHFALTYPPRLNHLTAFNELSLVPIPVRVFQHVHARYNKLDKSHLLVAAQRFNNRTLSLNETLHCPLNMLNLDENLQSIAISMKTNPEAHAQTLPRLIQENDLPPSQIIALCLALERVGMLKLHPPKQPEIDVEQQPDYHQELPEPEDHFSTLGLHWSAYDQEIQRRYHELSQQYLGTEQDDPPHASSIFDAVAQAYEAIRNPARRARYRSSIIDSYTIESALREFRNRAENYKLARDIDSAIDACCRIIELEPEDSAAREDLKTLRPLKLWSNYQQPDQSL